MDIGAAAVSVTVKKCAKCCQWLCLSLFDTMQTKNQRPRRKKICRSCLADHHERIRRPVTDHRDYRHPLEDVVRAWVQT